jgi:cystine transport system substrate-binding protein
VLAQATQPLRRPLLVALLATVALAVPAVSGAGSGPSAAELRTRDAAIEAKSRAAVLGLYSLDQQLAAARAHLTALQTQLGALRAERHTLTREIALARTDTRIAERNLSRRLQLIYERGRVEPLEILFGAKSLDEALTSIDNLQGVTKQDTAVLRSVTSAHAAFKRDSVQLAARVTAIDAATQRAAATTAALQQSRAERTAYIGSLATQRRLNEQQIAQLVAVAQAAQTRSAELAQVRATGIIPPISTPISDTSPAASAASDGRTLTVTATGYALGGTTSTGLPVGFGVAAVDPSVIPLGTHMYVPGYGEAVAADTGGAVVGDTIDLWFPSVAQAEQWGRRVVTITLH